MPSRTRSKGKQRDALTRQLRAEGQPRAEVAARLRAREHVSKRVAMRLARGWTQREVARCWNERWPAGDGSAGITGQVISYWETWPHPVREPTARTLRPSTPRPARFHGRGRAREGPAWSKPAAKGITRHRTPPRQAQRKYGYPMSFWRPVTGGDPKPTHADLARLLSSFHALGTGPCDLPSFDPLGPSFTRLARAVAIPDADRGNGNETAH
jgi:hypothetical protein